MAITVKDKIFNLETENTLYQMKVDRFGVLNHLWYGEKTDCCMDYLLDYPDAGFPEISMKQKMKEPIL